MQVCLDYQPAVTQRAGIGRYTRVLAGELLKTKLPDDDLRLFYLDFFRKGVVDIPGARTTPSRILPGAILQRLWRTVGFPPFDLLSGPADVFHFTNFLRPPLRRGRSVVTIFDMSFERFPQFAEAKNLRNLRRGIRQTAVKADAIITISDFSANEIAELLPESRGKLFPIPLGISPDFAPAPEEAVAALRAKTGLERPYILAVGTIEPRKNLTFLVDVFEQMAGDSALEGLDLVIAGMPGWRCEDILRRFETSSRAARIHYMRYVPDAALAALYTGAAVLAVPSHYEGFGFPPLEAMACGTPVVSSAGGSLPEVLGDAAVVVPDYDPAAWRAALGRAAMDGDLRSKLKSAGMKRAATYRWEKTATETWRVYRNEAEARA
jgi:glycosyltransferase involved in cell wall biosynthesis